jgi:hypothetical protein
VTDLDRLHRSYARLLRAYPRWYRRERGLELMTTLLDDAGPGRYRPRWTTVVDLVGGGVRTRSRPPRGFVARLITVVVALSGGLVGSSAAVMLSPYPGPPAAAQAVAAAQVAVALPVHDVPGPIVKCYEGSCEQAVIPGNAATVGRGGPVRWRRSYIGWYASPSGPIGW